MVAQAARTPDSVALSTPAGEQLTYDELVRRSLRLAAGLSAAGVGPEDRVGLYLERSWELVASMLAAVAAGAAYLPLSPTQPPARLDAILRDARPAAVLAAPGSPSFLAESLPNGVVLTVDAAAVAPAGANGEPALPAGPVSPLNSAYLLFTSGSTGKPKGAVISHAATVNHMHWMIDAFGFAAGRRVLQKTPIGFDASVWEFWVPLLSGGRLELAPLGWEEDPTLLTTAIETAAITDLQVVPSLLELLLQEPTFAGLHSLCRLFCGGEALSRELRDRLLARLDVDLVNLYGPTEATIDSLFHRCGSDDPVGAVPIGRPIEGASARVIDPAGRWASVGSLGELCVAGRGLGRGYFGRPRWTAEAFVPDLAGEVPGERMYRTGDLVRYLTDGRVDFHGRRDFQVKVRGHRIEPGEIESVMLAHPEVESAAVILRRDLPGGDGLVGYWVGSGTDGRQLRGYLADRLPSYMVPGAFVALEALPLTVAGKLDRRALPRPQAGDLLAQPLAVEPRTPTEREVAKIWCEVLEVDAVGVETSFFELGGHSLLATRVVSRLRSRFSIELPLKTLFQRPTVAGLAEFIDGELAAGGGRDVPPIEPRSDAPDAPLPLSFAQERLWFLQQMEPDSSAYNMPSALQLRGDLRLEALARSLGEVVARHEALRTRLLTIDGLASQRIDPPCSTGRLALPLIDLSALGELRHAALLRLASIEAGRPFDLAADAPLRCSLVRMSGDQHVLLLDVHHVAFDGWSTGILVGEIQRLYPAFAAGEESPLPPLPVQYGDYALWQRGWLGAGELERQLDYWRGQMAGANTHLELPTDRPRPRRPSYRAGRLSLHLAPALAADLSALCRRRGVTEFMAFLALYSALLARWSGQQELTVGSPIANRTRPEIEGLIGFFVNTLVLRADLSGAPSFEQLLARTEKVALDGYAHQDLPFERLVEELEPERDLHRTPLFQAMLVLQNAPARPVELAGLELERLQTEAGAAKFDLLLTLAPVDAAGGAAAGGGASGWKGEVEYSRDLFDATTIERWMAAWQRLLAAAVAAPAEPVMELPLLCPAQRHQLLYAFNDTAADPADQPHGLPVHLRFEAVARENLDRVAVAGEGWSLTYAALDRRAAQLATALRRLGVRTDSRVALGLARSAEMTVAVLAVLKAGAAYMPLDPTLPRERLEFMVKDASVSVLLSDRATLDRLPAAGLRVILLDADASRLAALEPTACDLTSPNALASLLYTSGSTGQPKGVAMSHGALANMVEWQLTASPAGHGSRSLQFAALSFDVSFQELFATWSSAGTLQLIDEALRRDAPALLAYLDRHRVERIFLPFVALHQLAEVAAESGVYPAALREVVTAGEQLVVHGPVAAFFDRLPASERTLANQYGPTEAHVVSQQLLVGPAAGWPALPAIGRPIRATRLLILDGCGQPTPLGVAGELFISGAALARGYLARPALTAASFLPDPWGDGGRSYRTGDLARILPSGAIEFLGRRDGQTKIRGHRVELGEVEAVLAEYPTMGQAAVAVHPDAGGRNSLVGYVVLDEELDSARLHSFLTDRLPGYMVPAIFVELPQLPLTASGKLARRALPAPDWSRADEQIEPPATPTEQRIASIWSELLAADRVGRQDNFFTLGGHSLLATQVISRINHAFGIELPLAVFFEHPTLAALSRRVEELSGGAAATRVAPGVPVVPEVLAVPEVPEVPKTLAIREARPVAVASKSSVAPAAPVVAKAPQLPAVLKKPVEIGGREAKESPLSFAQERLWFLEQFTPGSAVYNIPVALEVTGAIDATSLATALADVCCRHESLRTTFHQLNGRSFQRIAGAATVQPRLPVVDLSALALRTRRAVTLRLATLEAEVPFKLETGPLMRSVLVVSSASKSTLLLTMHHIVSDGWSMGVLVDEVCGYYSARTLGREFAPPTLRVQYADFAQRQRARLEGGELERQLRYWRSHLEGAPRLLELPVDRPRPAVQTTRGGQSFRYWSGDLQQGLAGFSRSRSSTLFMTLLAGLSLVLSRYSGQGDVVVGTPIANRTDRDLERLIGFFVNTLVLRVKVESATTFNELFDLARQTAIGAYAHQDVPFERLVNDLVSTRALDHSPLFQVMLVVQNTPRPPVSIPGLALAPLQGEGVNAKFDLTLEVTEMEEDLRVAVEYNRDLFDATTIERLLGHLRRVLVAGSAAPIGRWLPCRCGRRRSASRSPSNGAR